MLARAGCEALTDDDWSRIKVGFAAVPALR